MIQRFTVLMTLLALTCCISLPGVLRAEDAPAADPLQGALLAAYNADADAAANYDAFAAKAQEEGYESVAVLFKALSRSSSMLAEKRSSVLTKMGGTVTRTETLAEVKGTADNLATALQLATERAKAYGEHSATAEAAKNNRLTMVLKAGGTITEAHAEMLTAAMGDLEGWKAAGKELYVCTVCGEVMTTPEPEKCPICAAPSSKFETFK